MSDTLQVSCCCYNGRAVPVWHGFLIFVYKLIHAYMKSLFSSVLSICCARTFRLDMSMSNRFLRPGRCTLITTCSPLCITARCTCTPHQPDAAQQHSAQHHSANATLCICNNTAAAQCDTPCRRRVWPTVFMPTQRHKNSFCSSAVKLPRALAHSQGWGHAKAMTVGIIWVIMLWHC